MVGNLFGYFACHNILNQRSHHPKLDLVYVAIFMFVGMGAFAGYWVTFLFANFFIRMKFLYFILVFILSFYQFIIIIIFSSKFHLPPGLVLTGALLQK